MRLITQSQSRPHRRRLKISSVSTVSTISNTLRHGFPSSRSRLIRLIRLNLNTPTSTPCRVCKPAWSHPGQQRKEHGWAGWNRAAGRIRAKARIATFPFSYRPLTPSPQSRPSCPSCPSCPSMQTLRPTGVTEFVSKPRFQHEQPLAGSETGWCAAVANKFGHTHRICGNSFPDRLANNAP